jgi:hypothetical protein
VDTVSTDPAITKAARSGLRAAAAAGLCAPSRRRRRGLLIPFFLLLPLFTAVFLTAQQHPTESQVKAAYLYNFGKFVTWQPDQAGNSGSLDICLIGKDPFGPVLDATVAGESIDGRKITVTRIAKVQDAPQCRILFVGLSEVGRLGSILAAAQRFGMLTVSDIPNFTEQGGIIEFVSQQDRIRFEVNRAAAEQSHLVLSSQLLKVASKVIDKKLPRSQP